MFNLDDNGVLDIVEFARRVTLNSASQSPASRRAEQWQRSIQRRQHTIPQRMIYEESKLLELGSPGKENLLASEELSFYDSHSPQNRSPRPCSPSMMCSEDALTGCELLPSESNTPSKHMAIPLGSNVNTAGTGAPVGIKMGGVSYRLRRPLDDHDPNSMDSGYGASVLNDALLNSLNNSATITNAGNNSASSVASKLHSMFPFHSSSSSSISRHSSASSPTSSRRLLHSSLSSGSMESMDDMELFDMEAIDEQDPSLLAGSFQSAVQQQQHQAHLHHQTTMVPSGMNSLICGTIKTTRTATSPEQKRPFVRRCLSLNENASNQLSASPLASNGVGVEEMKTPDRLSRRVIAMEEQEKENCNITPFSSRMEVTRCFKRPEPPGVSPVQSKRCKTTQFDATALAAAAASIVAPPSVNALDSPARTTVMTAVAKKPAYQKSISMNDAQIMSALSRSSSEPDLIGDFSKSYVLPLMHGQHRDLKSISGETMARLLNGAFDDKIANFKIIDCRYPYEFEGGHIRGAKNLYTQEQIIEELIKSKSEPPQVGAQESGPVCRNIVVFHCEFSSERGPKLSRFLRNRDRALNANSYPALHYPEMYLLHGGYKEFFKAHADLCDPIAYRPMLDPEFGDAYRHFRAKSRSWNGDGTTTVKATAPTSSLTTGHRLTKSRSRLML